MDSCASAGEVPDYTMKINFSNVTGSTIIDEAGGASGTLFNVARTQLPSGAFYGTFGGNSSSYVDLTNREDLDFGSNFTIEAWIRPEIPNEHGAILAKGSGQAGYQYMLSDTGNICAPFANFTNSGWVYCGSQSSLDNNSWYQVVWTVETNNTEGFPQHNRAYIYVNMDRSLPTTTDGQILGSNSYNAYLGKGGYGNYKGDILFVRVYRKMLSPAEIYQNYVATAPLVMPEVKIENSSYMFENGAGSQNINITLDGEAVNTVSYVDVRAFGGTANSSDYNTDNNSNSGLIAAIGDSITEGSNVYYNNAHGYVGYLSQNLSAVDNWTIINYGVGGYTTDNVLSEYNSYVHPYHPSYGILR
ncbi:LamG-like jellyroll fold domain-containing protein [Methanosarcina mazei]|nr:LamG-like jellyroll fold domain-containing protein [Methanosarcina mazei]